MASNRQGTTNEEEIPLQNMRLTAAEEDYSYTGIRERKISKELFSQLPSHQPDFSDIIVSGSKIDVLSETTLRRRQSYYQTAQLKSATLTSPAISTDVDKIYEVLTSDPDTTYEQKIKTLQEMHQSLTVKRKVKEKLDVDKKEKVDKILGVCTRFKLQMNMMWHKLFYELQNISYSLEPWHSPIKKIQGQFGSGVASYFIFLRWLLYINICNFLVSLCFLIIPQLLYDSVSGHSTNSTSTFSSSDIFTGSGWFTDSLLYYGHYTSEVLEFISGLYYNMPLAYIAIICVNSIINLVAVSYSLTSSYQKSYIDTAGDVKNIFCNKVFSAWDYSIETEEAAKLRKIAFCNEIKELLGFIRQEVKEKTQTEKVIKFFLVFFINVFCLAVTIASGYLIYYLLGEKVLEDIIKIFGDMTLSLTVTLISTTFYFLLKYTTKIEFYFDRKTKLYLTMIRVVLLRTVMLGVIVYFWIIVNTSSRTDDMCYETELGKEIYRLILVNFFVAFVFFTFFGEFIRQVISSYIFTKLKLSQFDVAYNTLDLIYYQTLVWIGFFSIPLAPLVNIVILILLFYIKINSVSINCQPPRRTWSVNEAQTFFLTLVFFMFLLSAFIVGYMIFAVPASSCGPFQKLGDANEVFHNLIFQKGKEHEASEVIKYLSSPGVMFAFLCALCVLVYYMRAQAQAHAAVVAKNRERLIMEGKDKVFLLKLYEDALAVHSRNADNERNQDPASPSNGNRSSSTQEVVFNEGYSEYEWPTEPPLPKSLELGYIPADVPANKQSLSDSTSNIYNCSRTEMKFRSPSSSVSNNETPTRKAKGIHIPAHQPGFRHFHDSSSKMNEYF